MSRDEIIQHLPGYLAFAKYGMDKLVRCYRRKPLTLKNLSGLDVMKIERTENREKTINILKEITSG